MLIAAFLGAAEICGVARSLHPRTRRPVWHPDMLLHAALVATLALAPIHSGRREVLARGAAAGVGALAAAAMPAQRAHAAITADSQWPLWPALPVAP